MVWTLVSWSKANWSNPKSGKSALEGNLGPEEAIAWIGTIKDAVLPPKEE
jgi:hypothetical protein